MASTLNKYLQGWERHLRILQALSPITVQLYRRKVEEFFNWFEHNESTGGSGGNGKGIKALTRKDIEGYLEWCFYRGNGNHTRFTKLIALQKFFRYLVYEDIIKEDFTASIPMPLPVKMMNRHLKNYMKQLKTLMPRLKVVSLILRID